MAKAPPSGNEINMVVKPLDLMGGQSVFVTDTEDGNPNEILETVTGNGSRYAMVQKYLPEIASSGDKRIILIDGQPIPLALARIPPAGDHRGNLVTGAGTDVTEINVTSLRASASWSVRAVYESESKSSTLSRQSSNEQSSFLAVVDNDQLANEMG